MIKKNDDKDEKDKLRTKIMEDRMMKIEETMLKNMEQAKAIEILRKDQTKMMELLRKEQNKRVLEFKKAMGLNVEKDIAEGEQVNDSEQMNDKDKLQDSVEEMMNKTSDSYTSDWAKQLSGQLEKDANKETTNKKNKEKD